METRAYDSLPLAFDCDRSTKKDVCHMVEHYCVQPLNLAPLVKLLNETINDAERYVLCAAAVSNAVLKKEKPKTYHGVLSRFDVRCVQASGGSAQGVSFPCVS